MRLDFAEERVLAVVAHPDDAELLCAGALARARSQGASIAIAVVCQGDRGQPEEPIPDLAAVRQREMEEAAKLLEARIFFCGTSDGTLADNEATRRKLVEIYRQFVPTLVLAHDPADYHPDHQAASRTAEAASWLSASRGHVTDSPPLPDPPALWFMDTVHMLGFEPGFYIDVTDHFDTKLEMLKCHRSQLARASDVPPLAPTLELQASTRGMQAGVPYAEAFRIAPLMKRCGAW